MKMAWLPAELQTCLVSLVVSRSFLQVVFIFLNHLF